MGQEDALKYGERVRLARPGQLDLGEPSEVGTVKSVETGYFYLVEFGSSGQLVRLSLAELERV